MDFFKNLLLRTKVSLGFGLIVGMLIISVLFGFSGLKKMNENFLQYRETSINDTLAGRVQANLLESRIAFKNYIKTSDSSQRAIFEDRFANMENFIHEMEVNLENHDYKEKVKYIQQYAQEYKDGFYEVVGYQSERDEIYRNVLQIKGPAMEQNITALMETAYQTKNEQLHYGASNTMKNLLSGRMYTALYLENNDVQHKEMAETAMLEAQKWLDFCLQSSGNSTLIEEMGVLKHDLGIYSDGLKRISSTIEARNQVIQRMDEIGPQISVVSEDIKLTIISQQEAMVPLVKKSNDLALIQMVALMFLALLFSVFVTIFFVRIVVGPVSTVTNTFREISEGDANLEVRLKVDSKDELGDMARYFNLFMEKLHAIMLFNKNQSWLKSGQAELNERIRSEQDLETMSENIITYVSKYVNAQVGAFYIRTEDEVFKRMGSYAYKGDNDFSDQISIGEGLIGQSVREKQSILVENVPSDYIKITSGVGEGLPGNVLVTPCLVNNEVKCVLELGTFHTFTDIEKEYVALISESTAMSIHAAESRIKMQHLLNKTLEQSEELQVQQEELRQSNEELEEQTVALKQSEAQLQAQQEELKQNNEELEEQAKALRESEVRLQAQQEELRVINEELIERTKSLEIQKEEITVKNENLNIAQKEIQKKAKALEVASQYKSEFLANMSHELRTPLNSIMILSKILAEKQDNLPLTDKQQEYAKTIHTSGNDLLKLINDILDLAKVEAGKMDIVMDTLHLDEVLQHIESTFKPVAVQKGLYFTIQVSEDAPREIITDAQRLIQIINNLLSNAFKFTHTGGVTMTIGSDENREICIAVQDTGIGIPLDKQEIIFEAFKQTDGTTSRKYGGTGLGLSICKELANLLGGRILLSSEPGKGSRFTIIIPTHPKEKNLLDEVAATHENVEVINFNNVDSMVTQGATDYEISISSKNTESIYEERISPNDKLLLIIEDDVNFSQILADLARQKGYKCIVASRGEDGLELAIKYKPDGILIDIGLPDITGWQVIERLKNNAITEKIPVHVISGSESNASPEELTRIIGYLNKPINLEEIEDIFRKFSMTRSRPFKKLLILDEDKKQIDNIARIIEEKGIQAVTMDNGIDGIQYIKNESVDCIILDLKLKDMSGFDFLHKLREEKIKVLPVIIHTSKILTQEEETELRKYTESIIIKGERSTDRLIAETSLFLHDVDSKIEQKKIKAIKSENEKEYALSNKKILIVDDDMRNVFALTSVLEEKGMKVVVGRNGKEGLEKLAQSPDVDLILMDIMMPEMDGYTAMREIRKNEKHRKIPIIALTAKAMKDDKQKCIEAGANDYLTKPLDIDKLTSLLRVWLYQ